MKVAATREELERRLRGRPDDLAALEVYADWLSDRGDPRGEFVALMRRREVGGGTNATAVSDDVRRVFEDNREAFVPPALGEWALGSRGWTWANGFVSQLKLNDDQIPDVGAILRHPSLFLLLHLEVKAVSDECHETLVRTLRTAEVLPPLRSLELRWRPTSTRDVTPIVASFPGLESLQLRGDFRWEPLAHATLAELTIHYPGRSEAIDRLRDAKLPALKLLRLSGFDGVSDGPALSALLQSDSLPELEELALPTSTETDAACEMLAASPRQLKRLDLRGGTMTGRGAEILTTMRSRLDRILLGDNRLSQRVALLLGGICDDVQLGVQQPDSAEDIWFVRHTRRPEWGVGRVVSSQGNRATVHFSDGAVRTVLLDRGLLELAEQEEVPLDLTSEWPDRGAPTRPDNRDVQRANASLLAKTLETVIRDLYERLAKAGRVDHELALAGRRGARLTSRDITMLTGGSKSHMSTLRPGDARALLRNASPVDLVRELRHRVWTHNERGLAGRCEMVVSDREADELLGLVEQALAGEAIDLVLLEKLVSVTAEGYTSKDRRRLR